MQRKYFVSNPSQAELLGQKVRAHVLQDEKAGRTLCNCKLDLSEWHVCESLQHGEHLCPACRALIREEAFNPKGKAAVRPLVVP